MTLLSVIAVDYEYHVPRDGMVQGLQSLANQTFTDFELVVIHDGPKHKPYEQEFDFSVFKGPVVILNTLERNNDWGHSSRDLGMRNATGEYFIQFNIDNILYPHAMQTIAKCLKENAEEICIFEVFHHKLNTRLAGEPKLSSIDALQLVASRRLWEESNYWYDKSCASDGVIYEKLCAENPYIHINEMLGENF